MKGPQKHDRYGLFIRQQSPFFAFTSNFSQFIASTLEYNKINIIISFVYLYHISNLNEFFHSADSRKAFMKKKETYFFYRTEVFDKNRAKLISIHHFMNFYINLSQLAHGLSNNLRYYEDKRAPESNGRTPTHFQFNFELLSIAIKQFSLVQLVVPTIINRVNTVSVGVLRNRH